MSLRRALLLHGALLAAGLSVQGAGGNRHSLSLLAPLRDGGCPDGCDLGQGCDGGADSCGTDGCGEDVSKGKCGKCWESEGKICVSVCVKIDNPDELCFGDSITTEEDLIDGSKQSPANAPPNAPPKAAAAEAKAPVAVADPAVAPSAVAVAPVDPAVAPKAEPMSDQEREGAHNHPPDGKKLPTGTCKATNPANPIPNPSPNPDPSPSPSPSPNPNPNQVTRRSRCSAATS